MAAPKPATPQPAPAPDRAGAVTLMLCGDVMTGRGIDQVLPHPGDARLHESYVTDARHYVALAEAANGPIARPLDFAAIWGDALAEMLRRAPAMRIVNLETSITGRREPWPKGINYKMNPANTPCLGAARIDCCVLANNHVMDWGRDGLLDTLDSLSRAGILTVGAGRDAEDAARPAIKDLPGGGRVVVFAFGATTSGIPADWAAGPARPGVNLLPDLSPAVLRGIAERIAGVKQPGDIIVVSLHWGGNWGHEIPPEQRAFAHGLIEQAGADAIHGHSSHHPRAIEWHRGKLILYGCGDFLNDYEGIGGYEEYRGTLVLMYLPTLDRASGRLERLAAVPFRIEGFALHHATPEEARWLGDNLTRVGAKFGTRLELAEDGTLELARR